MSVPRVARREPRRASVTPTKKAVTEYVRLWISETYGRIDTATGEPVTYEAMAAKVGVTKQALYLVRDRRNYVGHKLEEGFAAAFFKGSVDRLRKTALSRATSAASAS